MKAIESILEAYDEEVEVYFRNLSGEILMSVIPCAWNDDPLYDSSEIGSRNASSCVHEALNRIGLSESQCENIDDMINRGMTRIVIIKCKDHDGGYSNEEVLGFMQRCGWKDFFGVYDKMKNGDIYELHFNFRAEYGDASSSVYSYSIDSAIEMALEMISSHKHLPDQMYISEAVESCTDY
ncbi:MAG: hypothetical protein NMNS01_25770 [Nitrosomonas sp.]|nr:MAG: hypothetical protein NMNS01_25770 [Nitrosomonas sp.]